MSSPNGGSSSARRAYYPLRIPKALRFWKRGNAATVFFPLDKLDLILESKSHLLLRDTWPSTSGFHAVARAYHADHVAIVWLFRSPWSLWAVPRSETFSVSRSVARDHPDTQVIKWRALRIPGTRYSANPLTGAAVGSSTEGYHPDWLIIENTCCCHVAACAFGSQDQTKIIINLLLQ